MALFLKTQHITKYYKTNRKTSVSAPLYNARPLKNVYYSGIGKRGRFQRS